MVSKTFDSKYIDGLIRRELLKFQDGEITLDDYIESVRNAPFSIIYD